MLEGGGMDVMRPFQYIDVNIASVCFYTLSVLGESGALMVRNHFCNFSYV